MHPEKKISEIDLILNPDGSVYHLHLHPDDLADTILSVGDPGRVEKVSKYFDRIELRKNNREFISHTGYIGSKRITVVSTGIGTGNIDIVLNELDALVNIDFEKRIPKEHLKSFNIIRIGTSGSLQPDIPVDSLLVSASAIGLDSLMHYYKCPSNIKDKLLLKEVKSKLPGSSKLNPYVSSPSDELMNKMATGLPSGITLTTPGFFAPQGRVLRAKHSHPELIKGIAGLDLIGGKVTNFEMETAGLYGMAAALGHKALSISVILTNLSETTFSANPDAAIDAGIKQVLTRIINNC